MLENWKPPLAYTPRSRTASRYRGRRVRCFALAVSTALFSGAFLSLTTPAAAADESFGYAVVDTAEGLPLRLRTESSTGPTSQVIDKIRDGARVKYQCWVHGESISGTAGSSDVWYSTKRGFLPGAYLKDKDTVPSCHGETPPPNTDTTSLTLSTPTLSHVETSGGPLFGRAGPGTGYDKTGRKYDNGQAIRVVCTTYGSEVDGNHESSRLWHKLVSGDFVSGAHVRGQGGMPCDGSTPQTMTPPESVSYIDTDEIPLTVRSGPGTYTPETGVQLADLTPVSVDCLLYGTSVTGTQGESSVWLRLSEGGYVAAAYVHQSNGWTPEVCGAPSSDDVGDQWPDCSLSGSEEEVYALMFGGYCLPPDDVMAADPGDPEYPTFAGQRPFLIMDVGPNGERSYGLKWDGCTVPPESALLPFIGQHIGDVSEPFGFNFRPACQVHDLGYRLIDRHILPESAEQPLDLFFAQMLGRICRTQYPDRLQACLQVSTAYGGAVMAADHVPKPDDYPRVYKEP